MAKTYNICLLPGDGIGPEILSLIHISPDGCDAPAPVLLAVRGAARQGPNI